MLICFLHICENKGHCAADQHLCFRNIDTKIPLLRKCKITSIYSSSVAVQPGLCLTWFSEDRFSRNVDHVIFEKGHQEEGLNAPDISELSYMSKLFLSSLGADPNGMFSEDNFITVYQLPIVNRCWYEMSYGTEEEEEEEDRKKRAKKDKEEEEKGEEEEVEYEEVEGEEEEGMSEEGRLFVEYGLVFQKNR